MEEHAKEENSYYRPIVEVETITQIEDYRLKIPYCKKYAILIISSFLLLAGYYAYDSPYAIKQDLKIKFYNNTSSDDYDYTFN